MNPPKQGSRGTVNPMHQAQASQYGEAQRAKGDLKEETYFEDEFSDLGTRRKVESIHFHKPHAAWAHISIGVLDNIGMTDTC